MVCQFTSFLLVGCLAAFVNVVVRYIIDVVLSYDAAIVIAFLAGLSTAYFLNKRYVFPDSKGPAHRQYGKFAVVNLLMLAQVWAVSVGLAEFVFPAIGFFWHAYDIAHVIGVGSPVITSYFAHKYFSFA